MNNRFDKNKITIVIREQKLFDDLAKGYMNSKASNKSQYLNELLKAGLKVAGIMSCDDLMSKDELRKLIVLLLNNYEELINKMNQLIRVVKEGYGSLIKVGKV